MATDTRALSSLYLVLATDLPIVKTCSCGGLLPTAATGSTPNLAHHQYIKNSLGLTIFQTSASNSVLPSSACVTIILLNYRVERQVEATIERFDGNFLLLIL